MKILRFSLGQLATNCYFLIREKKCLIIDPADEAGFILEQLQRMNLVLSGMLITHGHFDHLMAAGEVQRSFKIPLYISSKDHFLVDRLAETAQYFLGYKPIILPIKIIKNFERDGLMEIENFKWQIFFTPGHTPGSCCFYFPDEKIIFTGDTLFKNGIGRYDFSYSNKKDLKNSLRRILSLPEEVTVYPGHGEETTVGKEKNKFSTL